MCFVIQGVLVCDVVVVFGEGFGDDYELCFGQGVWRSVFDQFLLYCDLVGGQLCVFEDVGV